MAQDKTSAKKNVASTNPKDKGKKKAKKPIKPTSIRNQNVISDRVLSVVAFIISSAYILGLVLDLFAESINYDLLPIQTLVYYMAPMFICLTIAYIFNGLATFLGHSWWNLMSSIMYVAVIATFTPLWYCVIIQLILTFLSFFRMRNRELKKAKMEAVADQSETPLVDTPNKKMEKMVDEADAKSAKASKKSK